MNNNTKRKRLQLSKEIGRERQARKRAERQREADRAKAQAEQAAQNTGVA